MRDKFILMIAGVVFHALAWSGVAPAVGQERRDAEAQNVAARLRALAAGPAYDLVYTKESSKPIRVEPTLPRPFKLQNFRRSQRIKLTKLGTTANVWVTASKIAKVELFEQLLLKYGTQALDQKDLDIAFDLFIRLVQINEQWPGAKEKLHQVFYTQAENALGNDPPDFETAVNLCLQLKAADRRNPRVQSLLRRSCLGRAKQSLEKEDYATTWEFLNLYVRDFPKDPQALDFRAKLRSKAEQLIAQANRAAKGKLEDQRLAVGHLLAARRIWPDAPNIDNLIRGARKNYPVATVAVFDLPGTYEPLGARSLVDRQSCQLMFDAIAELDSTGSQFYRGSLIKRWQQQALGMRQTFEIKRGVFWSDGKPITAYDLQATLRLWSDPRSKNYDPERARYIGDVRTLDPFTAVVNLQRPHPRPLSLFAVPVLPGHLLAKPPGKGSDFSLAPTVSGPFQVADADNPQQARFVANPEFRGGDSGQPFIKEVSFQQYVKAGAAMTDLKENKVQLLTELDPLQVIELSSRSGQFEVRNYLANSCYMLAINHRRAPFNELSFRRAVLLAIDRQAILDQYFHAKKGGLAHHLITGPFPTHCPGYDRGLQVRGQDSNLAKELVESVARQVKTDRTLTLKYPLGNMFVAQAVIQMKKELELVGLKVRAEGKIPADLHREVIEQQDFDLVYWRYDHRNVLYNIAALFDPEEMQPAGTNFMGYRDGSLVRLFSELRREQRTLDVWEIQKEIHRHCYDEVLFVPLWQLDNYVAHTSRLVYRQSAADEHHFASARQVPIHPLYLFRKTEGWQLEQ